MRIAFVDNHLKYGPEDVHEGALGGTETSIVCLAEALRTRNHEVHVYLAQPGVTGYRGVTYHAARELVRCDCDVIVARNPQLLEVHKRDHKRIWWCHNPVDSDCVRVAEKRLVYPVLTSRFQAEQLVELGWKGGFDIVPLGCRLLDLPPVRCRRKPFTAVWISAFDRGLDRLIEIWRSARPELPACSKLLIGGGKEVYRNYRCEEELWERALKESTRGERDIEWLGPLGPRELLPLLESAGCLPYTARFTESFCLSVLEAQAAGCLPIVTPLGALRERVVHGRTGWVEPLAGFRHRLLAYARVAEEPEIEAMRRAAREAAAAFTWDEVARRFEVSIANCAASTL